MIIGYIDPGTGSIIFQMLIAGLMSLMFFFRRFFSSAIKTFLKIFKRKKKEENE